jgi:hypothetical protein
MGCMVSPVLDIERARRKEGAALRAALFRSIFFYSCDLGSWLRCFDVVALIFSAFAAA